MRGEKVRGILIMTILHIKENKPVSEREIYQKKEKFLFYGLMTESLPFSCISFLNNPKPIL